METFNCAPNFSKSKHRQNLSTYSTNYMYHNVTRNFRPIGSEYAMPQCSGRRSVTSLHYSRPCSEQPSRLMSTVDLAKKSRKGKLCSIALAIASFVVLVTILAIAGLALHMGILHTDTTNPLLTFSCSARILKGDRFVGPLQDKARRYKWQFETLYQKSILGQAFVSCTVDKFGNDTQTIYFKLAFNRKKLTKNASSVEKAIKDIILTDAISRNSVFKNIRFDPRHLTVSQILDPSSYQSTLYSSSSEKNTATPSYSGVIRKIHNKTLSGNLKKPALQENISKNNDQNGAGVRGSFKISKTDADITEKKHDSTPSRSNGVDKSNSSSNKKKVINETSVISTLYKVSAVEKVTKPHLIANGSTMTITTTTTTSKSDLSTPEIISNTPVFVRNPFDNEPWIPILPNMPVFTGINHYQFTNNFRPTASPRTDKEPIYTSFTNPGLSSRYNNDDYLGSTSLKSHPLPVNKIPITEASLLEVPGTSTNDDGTSTDIDPGINDNNTFVEIETVEHIPQKAKPQSESIDSTEDNSRVSILDDPDETEISRQGQVEVVIDDSYDLIHTRHTTKTPLVTLLPVKSNSGIGRPIRKRPNEMYKLRETGEHRGFAGSSEVITSSDGDAVSDLDFSNTDLKIFGVLNFVPEKFDDDANEQPNTSRSPKMDLELASKNSNDTILSSKRNYNSNYSNILTSDELKELSQISKVSDKNTAIDGSPDQLSFSTKAISSSSSVNQLAVPLLKKKFNLTTTYIGSNDSAFETECTNSSLVCGDGKCFPATSRCNQLIDCEDGRDEENCTCSDYLKSHYLLGKICDGIVDCWDYSDERQCDWCRSDQYVCSNSKVCIDRVKICDGIKDCPQGDDEAKCVTITSDVETAQEFAYHSEGFLMVRKYGVWGKLCVDNFENISLLTHLSWQISDLGKAVCKSMTYQNMESIKIVNAEDTNMKYFELAYFSHNNSKSNLSFQETTCVNKRIVKVKCEALECGVRPQIVKHIARVVGGNNAGLGAWPWQAALYKEGEFQCGATLLSDRWLVSAGHCFYHSLRDHWVARLGALRRGTALPSPYEQLKTVERIVIHPGYVDTGYINDISLLQLETSVVFSDYVRPVCLPAPHQLPLDGTLCTIIGWGQLFEVGRIFPDTLQEVQVPIISTAECRKRTLFLPLYKITDDMFCAGYDRGGRDACLGDSGGPLMCPESNGKWTLQGITSNGYGCARANRPGVYTKVANYVDWIHLAMNNETVSVELTRKKACPGHRCPLGECLSQNRLCNGFIECSDGSDEKNCENRKL